jgi:hypothetical protein
MLSRITPIVRKFGTRNVVSGTELANVVPGTLPSVLGIVGTALSSVGGFYFLIESKIKENKKEIDTRMEKFETKLDNIGLSVARIEEKLNH